MEATALVLDGGEIARRAPRRRPRGRVRRAGRRRCGSGSAPRPARRPTTSSSTRSTRTRRRRRPAGRRSAATGSGTPRRSTTPASVGDLLGVRRLAGSPRPEARAHRLGPFGRRGPHREPAPARRGRDDPRLEPGRAVRPRRRSAAGGRRGGRPDLHRGRVRRASRRRGARRAGGVVRLRRPAPRARPPLDGRRVRVPPGLRRQHRPLRVVPHGARAPSACSANGSRSSRCRRGRLRPWSRAAPSRCRTPPPSRWRSGVTRPRGSRRTRRSLHSSGGSRCPCSSRRRSTRSGSSSATSSSASPTSRRRASRGRRGTRLAPRPLGRGRRAARRRRIGRAVARRAAPGDPDRRRLPHCLAVRALLRARPRGEGTLVRAVPRDARVLERPARVRPDTKRVPLRGYEPVVSHRHFGKAAPVAPEAGELLVQHSLELTDELFDHGR